MERINGLADAINGVLAEVREKFKNSRAHESMLQSLQAFAAAVDWKEPWIVGLIAFQLLFFLIAVLTRHRQRMSGCLFAIAAIVVYMAERLNKVLAQNWRTFAKQPYFDQQGIFFSAVVSAPLLLTMFFLVVSYLLNASSLLIKLKRKELRQNARKRARQEAEGESSMERKNKKSA